MGTFIAIACLVLIVVLVIYIIGVSGLDKAESKFRNESSTIDTYLWDIQHRLKKASTVLEKYSIDTADIKDTQELGLGMPVSLQMMKYSDYSTKMENLEKVDTTALSEEDKQELEKYIQELENLRVELVGESIKHNKAVNAYNSRIAQFPYSFVAKRKKKDPKGIFVCAMKNKE
ncbi:MAG: hypothetical protein IJ703_04315 [Eubacterium sp.]|nr:hypothetical protein [Eubacterium sp.]